MFWFLSHSLALVCVPTQFKEAVCVLLGGLLPRPAWSDLTTPGCAGTVLKAKSRRELFLSNRGLLRSRRCRDTAKSFLCASLISCFYLLSDIMYVHASVRLIAAVPLRCGLRRKGVGNRRFVYIDFVWFYVIWYDFICFYLILYDFIPFHVILYNVIWLYMLLYDFTRFYKIL